MRVVIKENYEAMSEWTANYIADRINQFNPDKNNPFVLGLPTGSTPIGTYKALIRLNKEGKVSFKNVVTFNMDEYVGLSREHAQSYNFFMWDNFFNHIDILRENVHILYGQAQDLQKECDDYEACIKSYGKIHLFLGGMGENGHIAFNEPGSSLQSRTRIVPLTKNTIMANARFFDNDMSQVPTSALSVGVGTIMDSEEVIILGNGPKKAVAVQKMVEGPITHMCPISAVQNHPKGILVCDDDASDELKVGTVKFFKGIENL